MTSYDFLGPPRKTGGAGKNQENSKNPQCRGHGDVHGAKFVH